MTLRSGLNAPHHIRLDFAAPGSIGLIGRAPRISWHVEHAPDMWHQESVEIRLLNHAQTELASQNEDARGLALVHVCALDTSDQIGVPWPFEQLESRQRVAIQIRVSGGGLTSDWSTPAEFETGLLNSDDWVAKLVGPAWHEDSATDRQPPLIRGEAELKGQVRAARLYITAHGLVESEINGHRVGLDDLVPGWTVYDERLPYRSYDVTSLLKNATTAVIGCWLGDGWYRGHIGFDGGSYDNFGTDIGVIAQLEIEYDDGTRQVIASDGTWTAGRGPIQFSGLYEGETYDARELPTGWHKPGFISDGFTPVAAKPQNATLLVTPAAEPVQCVESLHPRSIEPRGNGTFLMDFGQNAAGRLRIRINTPAGTTITVRHAEVLEDGELGVRPLRRAAAVDTYIADGSGPVEWEPRFTIHGFRYAEISGWPGELNKDDVAFRILSSATERTGWFSCSHPRLTKLYENIAWSTTSNFVSIPTDCPQRDERLGWTGDLQVFASSATYLYNLTPLISDWLKDLWVEQKRREGAVPVFVPTIPGHFWDGKDSAAVWGDVAALAPWSLYRATGDKQVLRDQVESATAWVDHVQGLAGDSHLWTDGFQLGDWLDPAAPPDNPLLALTDAGLIATAYMAHSTETLGWIHTALGNKQAADERFAQAQVIKASFQEHYVSATGELSSDTQAAYALALDFAMLTPQQELVAGERLAELVREANGNIATGFAGTPVVCRALAQTGHVAEAYLLLEQDTCPSWLYTVSMGATTTWERWDSMLPDGAINSGDMTSFNHYALGAVAQWLHEGVAGLEPAAPGYKKIRIAPHPGGSLTWARTAHVTPYGLATVEWHVHESTLTVRGHVPVGTTAFLDLPGAEGSEELSHGLFERTVPFA